MMELEYEFTLRAEIDDPIAPGDGPFGTRMIVTVTGGGVEGERLNGKLQGAAADWLLVGPDGFARLDVRGQFVTDDGAAIYINYGGLLEMNQAVGGAMGTDAETQFSDQYFRTTPRLETGDDRYAWVNTTAFVGEGRLTSTGVEYRVFRVT